MNSLSERKYTLGYCREKICPEIVQTLWSLMNLHAWVLSKPGQHCVFSMRYFCFPTSGIHRLEVRPRLHSCKTENCRSATCCVPGIERPSLLHRHVLLLHNISEYSLLFRRTPSRTPAGPLLRYISIAPLKRTLNMNRNHRDTAYMELTPCSLLNSKIYLRDACCTVVILSLRLGRVF